jgi:hypothetical protein
MRAAQMRDRESNREQLAAELAVKARDDAQAPPPLLIMLDEWLGGGLDDSLSAGASWMRCTSSSLPSQRSR